VLRLLRQFSKDAGDKNTPPEPMAFQSRLSSLSIGARFKFREALAALAAQAPTDRPTEPLLLRLAEHVAIRFAMESYERGEMSVSAVQQVLNRMAQEIEALRKILVAHETKMADAGVVTESYADLLDRQFWAVIPDPAKRNMLLSPEAWSVAPRNIRQYVDELLRSGEKETARRVLENYIAGIAQEKPEACRKTSTGLCELAEIYGEDRALLADVIARLGTRLVAEHDSELRSQVSAAFVRLSQEAATRRSYPAMQQALKALQNLEVERAAFASSLRLRVGLDARVPEFIEDALREETVPEGLSDLLQSMPRAAAQHITVRFGRSGFREDCDLLIRLASDLGPEGTAHLRKTFSTGSPVEAIETVGLLSRLDPELLEQGLPNRLRECPRSFHDRVVRQLAAGGSQQRGRLLVAIFEALDFLIRPLALDEIGMSGDTAAIQSLVNLAGREDGAPFLRLKAIEALARLGAREAVPALRRIVETKQVWRWVYPAELRIVAAQALAKIDKDWWQAFSSRSGLDPAQRSFAALDRDSDASGVRQRRYPRLRLVNPLAAVTTNLRDNCQMEIQSLGLGGGLATADRHFPSGTMLTVKINYRLHSIRAQVFVRDARAKTLALEIADINLEDRARLRRLLVELGNTPLAGSPKNRVRRRRTPDKNSGRQ
jgi:hypothetical protein